MRAASREKREKIAGFVKPGTTLEGRVAQLLRIQGFKVMRNKVVEGHEIDVYAKGKDGKTIAVECKEYYTELVDRDKILIFAAKIHDIKPDEAWFVTISDFEPPALELCKKYGMHAVSGYKLEELEERATKGKIELGPIPKEDRLFRHLQRKRLEMGSGIRRDAELRRMAEDIYKWSKKPETLMPPFLISVDPSAEEKVEEIWYSDLQKMKKICELGKVEEMNVDVTSTPPRITGFQVTKKYKVSISPFIALIALIAGVIGAYIVAVNFWYIIPILPIFVALFLAYRSIGKILRSRTYFVPTGSAYLEKGEIILSAEGASTSPMIEVKPLLPSRLPARLVDGTVLGSSIDYSIDLSTWTFKSVKVKCDKKIKDDTGYEEATIPIEKVSVVMGEGAPQIQVSAKYILGE